MAGTCRIVPQRTTIVQLTEGHGALGRVQARKCRYRIQALVAIRAAGLRLHRLPRSRWEASKEHVPECLGQSTPT